MNIRTTFLTAALVLCGAAAGAKEPVRSDAWISTKVKATLAAHRNVSAFRTDVETKNGVVTLRGKAKTAEERRLAERYAADIAGVKSVDNRILVEGEDEQRASETRPVSRELGDASLTARVKAALATQRGASAWRTDVDTVNGTVTLYGTAKSVAERELAEKTAAGVDGVKSVDNRIEVK